MMHEQFKCHYPCSNTVRLMFNLSSNSQNWLEHRVSNKKPPKFEKPLKQFVINWRIDHLTWEKTDKHDQLYQYDKPISSIKPI